MGLESLQKEAREEFQDRDIDSLRVFAEKHPEAEGGKNHAENLKWLDELITRAFHLGQETERKKMKQVVESTHTRTPQPPRGEGWTDFNGY